MPRGGDDLYCGTGLPRACRSSAGLGVLLHIARMEPVEDWADGVTTALRAAA